MARMLYDRMATRVVTGITVLIGMLVLSVWGMIIYVAWHFISKNW